MSWLYHPLTAAANLSGEEPTNVIQVATSHFSQSTGSVDVDVSVNTSVIEFTTQFHDPSILITTGEVVEIDRVEFSQSLNNPAVSGIVQVDTITFNQATETPQTNQVIKADGGYFYQTLFLSNVRVDGNVVVSTLGFTQSNPPPSVGHVMLSDTLHLYQTLKSHNVIAQTIVGVDTLSFSQSLNDVNVTSAAGIGVSTLSFTSGIEQQTVRYNLRVTEDLSFNLITRLPIISHKIGFDYPLFIGQQTGHLWLPDLIKVEPLEFNHVTQDPSCVQIIVPNSVDVTSSLYGTQLDVTIRPATQTTFVIGHDPRPRKTVNKIITHIQWNTFEVDQWGVSRTKSHSDKAELLVV
jgi:hypothetical protein